MLYFAYGSNLNKGQMAYRCPAATPIGAIMLPKARLVFRGVADVEWHDSETVLGGLWRITTGCEAALDRYEGVRSGMYRKEYLTVQISTNGRIQTERALIYIMNRDGYGMPNTGYLDVIRAGYLDFSLDERKLEQAVKLTRSKVAKAQAL